MQPQLVAHVGRIEGDVDSCLAAQRCEIDGDAFDEAEVDEGGVVLKNAGQIFRRANRDSELEKRELESGLLAEDEARVPQIGQPVPQERLPGLEGNVPGGVQAPRREQEGDQFLFGEPPLAVLQEVQSKVSPTGIPMVRNDSDGCRTKVVFKPVSTESDRDNWYRAAMLAMPIVCRSDVVVSWSYEP